MAFTGIAALPHIMNLWLWAAAVITLELYVTEQLKYD